MDRPDFLATFLILLFYFVNFVDVAVANFVAAGSAANFFYSGAFIVCVKRKIFYLNSFFLVCIISFFIYSARQSNGRNKHLSTWCRVYFIRFKEI